MVYFKIIMIMVWNWLFIILVLYLVKYNIFSFIWKFNDLVIREFCILFLFFRLNFKWFKM